MHTLLLVPALGETLARALVGSEDDRLHAVQSEAVEEVLEEQHLRLVCVALAPVLLLTDDRSGRREAIHPVDPVHTHVANVHVALFEADGEHEVACERATRPVCMPVLLLDGIEREHGSEVLADLRVVHPALRVLEVLALDAPHVDALTLQEHNPLIVTHGAS